MSRTSKVSWSRASRFASVVPGILPAMARTTRLTQSRVGQVLLGVILGAAWGLVMWLITGTDSGGRGLVYLVISTAMIGGGVSAIFGAVKARRQGESIGPNRRRD